MDYLSKGELPDDPQLRDSVGFLRRRVPIVSRDRVQRLPQLSEGAEAKVYIDPRQEAVYKLIELDAGRLRGGLVADGLAPDPDGGIRIVSRRIPTLMDYLGRLDLNNRHGQLVFTEIAGATPDGALLVKQPYIREAYATDPIEAQLRLGERGLRPVGVDEIAAVADVDGRPTLFEDLHGGNVLRRSDSLFIVDAPSRLLTRGETRMLPDTPG